MKKIVLSFVILITMFSYGQSDPFVDDTIEYLTINGTQEQYEHAYDGMFTMLEQQFSSKDISDAVWEELKSGKAEAIKELKAMMVSAYKGHFTHADIKKMLEFYKTDTGKKLVKDRRSLSEEDNKKIADFYDSEIGKKIVESKNSLSVVVSQISEMWSSDLYRNAVDKLNAQ